MMKDSLKELHDTTQTLGTNSSVRGLYQYILYWARLENVLISWIAMGVEVPGKEQAKMFLPWFLRPAEGLNLNSIGGKLQGARPLCQSLELLSFPALSGASSGSSFSLPHFPGYMVFYFLYRELRLGSF